MNHINMNQELQLLDSALSFLTRSQISGGESERMTEVKEFLLGRLRQIQQATMQEEGKIAPAAPPAKMPPTN